MSASFDVAPTLMAEKLILGFLRNPNIATSVQTLTHRCHLATPALFTELERTPFTAQTLSIDPRTIRLVQMAVKGKHSMTLKNARTSE